MKKIVAFAFIAVPFLIWSCSKDDDSTQTTSTNDQAANRVLMMQSVTDNWLLPHLDTLVSESQELQSLAHQYQANPTESNLQLVKDQWLIAAKSWVAIECSNIGDAKYTFLYANAYTYPIDTTRINDLSSDSVTNEIITNAPSNAIGLAAIEFLLFEQDLSNQNVKLQSKHFTDWLVGLTDAFYSNAVSIKDFWVDEYASEFRANEGTGTSEPISLIFNGMVSAIDYMKTNELGEALGKTGYQPDTTQLRAFYSGYSKELYQAQFASIYDCYNRGDLGFDWLISEMKLDYSNQLATEVIGSFKSTSSDISATPSNWNQGVENQDQSLEDLYSEITTLIRLNKSDVASHLSLTITFSDSDGD